MKELRLRTFGICFSLLFILLIIIAGCIKVPSEKYENFAKCLNSKNTKLYGWFPYRISKNQIKLFGESWRFLNYTECFKGTEGANPELCKEKKIKIGYPTWEFADGSRIDGLLTLEELSAKTGCELPKE